MGWCGPSGVGFVLAPSVATNLKFSPISPMTPLLSALRIALWTGFFLACRLEAQNAGPRSRFTVTAGGARIGFPDVFVPSTSAITGSARVRLLQQGDVAVVGTAHFLVPFTVTARDASCPPTADCASSLSPSSLMGWSIGVGRSFEDKLTLATHIGAVRAAGMEGGGPATRATLAADLSWRLGARRAAPVVGLTAVTFLGKLAGSRGYLTPTLGFAW